jgi:hypothetical protein
MDAVSFFQKNLFIYKNRKHLTLLSGIDFNGGEMSAIENEKSRKETKDFLNVSLKFISKIKPERIRRSPRLKFVDRCFYS